MDEKKENVIKNVHVQSNYRIDVHDMCEISYQYISRRENRRKSLIKAFALIHGTSTVPNALFVTYLTHF